MVKSEISLFFSIIIMEHILYLHWYNIAIYLRIIYLFIVSYSFQGTTLALWFSVALFAYLRTEVFDHEKCTHKLQSEQ